MAVNVTVIGCGAVVQGHYKAALQRLERHGAIKVVGLIDRNINLAKALGKHFRHAYFYDNVAAGIKDGHSQFVIVASPASLHAEHTIAALTSNHHVLCEKPMAITTEQCRSMNHVAQNSGKKLSVGMIRRYYPSLVKAKALLESGEIGDIVSFTYREGRQYNWPVASSEGFLGKGGRGILLDIGSHVIDTFMWFFGRPRVISYADDGMINGIEASCVTRLDFNGISGFVHLSWDYDLANKFEIFGTKSKISVSLDGIDSVAAFGNKGAPLTIPDVTFPVPLSETQSDYVSPKSISDLIYIHIAQFLDSIAHGEKPAIDGEDGLAVISVIDECYRNAEPIEMNWLPVDQDIRFKKLHWRQQSWGQ